MNKTFTEVIIANLYDIHRVDLMKIRAAIDGILSTEEGLLKEVKKIKEEKSTFKAVKYLRDAGSKNSLQEDLNIVRSL